MKTKIKKALAMLLAIATLIACFVLSAYAVTGTTYSDNFNTTSSVTLSTHNYGYKDIKMRADSLWSNNGNQKFKLYLYTKSGSSYVSQGYCLCNTSTSGGEYTWYNANTNAVLPKPARFIVSKTSENTAEIGGTIVSWSQE
jgi:hypothetical protein